MVQVAARWWELPPPQQITHLTGADPDLLDLDLDPLPPGAPAVIRFRPGGPVSPADLLGELDRAALALFPAWLPGAERLEGPQGHGVAAVRALAMDVAARSANFGPFLADLAERALRGRAVPSARFAPEVRAAGLARVLAGAYDRPSAALLVHLPEGPAAASVIRAAEALAGRFSVWLAGPLPAGADRIRSVPVTVPRHLRDLPGLAGLAGLAGPPGPVVPLPVLAWPPLSGRPRADSAAETTLERALAPHAWARGRHWNHTYEWHILGQLYRLDLCWPAQRLVVELDGPEHRQRLRYAADRRRDNQLQELGHVVLRFTNEDVLADPGAVVARLHRLLTVKENRARA